MVAHAHEISSPETAAQMARAAGTFLSALSPDQLIAVEFTFEDKERLDWHYVPRNRSGLALKDMSDEQRILALEFLKTGLSPKGYWKSTTIIKLEAVLREIETWNWMGRDPEKYFFSFFGQPSDTGTWGWRVEGHHLSLNITPPKFWGDITLWAKINSLADRQPPLIRIEGPGQRLPQWEGIADLKRFRVFPLE
jgi:hypothetical protein